jgi:signal transduction histidine kinase
MALPPDDRLFYFDLGENDRLLLAELRPLLEEKADLLVAGFYRHLLSFPATRQLLRDPLVKERLLLKQREYLISLATPTLDEAYTVQRRRIGEVHERIGLEPRWYLGAYALYLSLLSPLVFERYASDLDRAQSVLAALRKLLFYDASIAMESYIERHEAELEYLNRELSDSGRSLARDFEEQGAELRRTRERARAAEQLASIGTLVAGLAHEIGTPMGVIQGHAKLLESAVSGEQAQWRVKTIQEQIARISRIIHSLLNMARPTRATPRTAVPLEPLIESTLAFLTEKITRRGIRVERDLKPVPSVLGDPERLQQLLLNLFLNAADAMRDGGVLRVSLGPAQGADVEVRGADTGVGIAEADLERIFDPFFTSKPAGEGHGLGLAVAKGIVADHGGEISVSSVVGEGTEFQILLPFPGGRGDTESA